MQLREFDFKALGESFQKDLKYGDSLLAIGQEIGVSASTLSRLKNGKPVDLNTAIRVCDWLKLHLSCFIIDSK